MNRNYNNFKNTRFYIIIWTISSHCDNITVINLFSVKIDAAKFINGHKKLLKKFVQRINLHGKLIIQISYFIVLKPIQNVHKLDQSKKAICCGRKSEYLYMSQGCTLNTFCSSDQKPFYDKNVAYGILTHMQPHWKVPLQQNLYGINSTWFKFGKTKLF